MHRTRAAPAGQSLAELIVALTLLSACLGAVGASAILGARWTAEAELRQEAVREAEAILDSLLATPASEALAPGEKEVGGLIVRWTIDPAPDTALGAPASPGGPALRESAMLVAVTAARAGGGPRVTLRNLWIPTPPALPPTAEWP